MVLLFDADRYPPHERIAAYEAILSSSTSPVSVTADCVGAGDRLRAWHLGASGLVLEGRSSGQQHARRTARHVRMGDHGEVSFSVNLRGNCASVSRDHCAVRNGEVRVLDLSSPYEKRKYGLSTACAFDIEYESLGLSVDVVRAAIPHVAASPLHALAASHLTMLPRTLSRPESGRALPMLAETTVQLMRALVTSVTADDAVRRQGLAESQLARADAYIAQRLRDPALSPAEIAASQFMSLRQLYKLFAQRSSTPAEWIISLRLAGARDELARRPGTPISLVAATWGFRTPGHFTRRFRAAYGILPSAWAEQFKTPHPLTEPDIAAGQDPVRGAHGDVMSRGDSGRREVLAG